MKPVVMLPEQWETVREAMQQREKPSTILSRSKMREVLGFTDRIHEEYVSSDKALRNKADDDWFSLAWADSIGPNAGKVFQRTVHLDFYNEQKRVMFLLKYGDYIGEKK
jgi:hypothetical protein